MAAVVGRTVTVSPEMLRALSGWQAPALGALATFALGLALALVANVAVIAGISGAGFALGPAVVVLLYGSFGIASAGRVGGDFGDFSASASYSVSVTILGAFLIMLAALAFGGWLASRRSRPEDRGVLATGVKTAILFGVAMFVGSFFFSYAGMHPRHVEALFFPLLFGLVATTAGARVERDGAGFWRAPVDRIRAFQPQIVQALGSGFDAVARLLKLATVASVIALIVLALNYRDVAGQILGGRRLITEILLIPLWLPHLVGVTLLAAQGIAFRIGAGGTLGSLDSLAGGPSGPSISIFGATGGGHVPGYLVLLVAVPIVAGLWGGYLAARRRGGAVGDRFAAALWASLPFVVLTWIVATLVGIRVEAGVSVVSGGLSIGPVPVNAIFWPLVWGPAMYLAGAALQLWRSGALTPYVDGYKARLAAVQSASPDGALAVAPPASVAQEAPLPPAAYCPACGRARGEEKPFCTSCGHRFEG